MNDSYRDWPESQGPLEALPACPRCGGRDTGFCGIAPDGPVYLCSPCCEAFFAEPPAVDGAPSGWGWPVAWLLLAVAFAFMALAWWNTPASPPPGKPAQGQQRRF